MEGITRKAQEPRVMPFLFSLAVVKNLLYFRLSSGEKRLPFSLNLVLIDGSL